MRRIIILAIVGLAACGGGGKAAPTTTVKPKATTTTLASTPIRDAADACEMEADDDGKSISFDTKGEEDSRGDDVTGVVCVLKALEAPDSLYSKLDHTRALDGTVSDEWGDFKATWSYHPDSGLFLVVEDQ